MACLLHCRYLSANEVARDAFRLIEESDRIREARLEALRGEIAIGVEQGDKGKVIDGEEVFKELREDIRQISSGEYE
ncbi:MAG: type II toxin-antitoxin system ParD family antitoxin [Rhizonema sp. PD37]|nr:type II toxin-antitoxin system ParD family antitoxin [Rhizonema sp. PD37]